MLVLLDFDSLTDRARLDKLLDVSPKAWPDVPVSGHLDCLLLAGMCVLVKGLYCRLSISWRKEEDGSCGYVRGSGQPQ